MGAKIDSFLNSFNDALLKAIDANTDKKANFDRVRADAIKISVDRSGNWPNNPSIKTIGDLFGFIFPAEGGIINEPKSVFKLGNSTSVNPEYLTYLEDVNNFKKIYDDLKKYYIFGKRSNSLKEKGGAQFWFDHFMHFSYILFLKNDSFLKKMKDANEDSSSDFYQLMPNGGSSVSYYNTFDIFDLAIYSDSNINESDGVNKFITKNLSTDELLYDAFIEAGDSYEGPYTKDIKDPVNFFNLLDGDVPKIATEVIIASASIPEVTPVVATPSTIAATPSSKIPLVINGISEGFTIQAKTDMPLFSIYVGEKPLESSNIDIFNDSVTADDEYIEADFSGIEDSVVDLSEEFLSFPESNVTYNDSSNTSLDDPSIEKSMAKISDASKKETESDKQLTLIREATSSDKGVKGTMYFNGKVVALTLERPYNPPQNKKQGEKCITAGTYNLSLDSTTKDFIKKHYVKFPESDIPVYRTGVAPRINNVPSQQGIRIHGGGNMTHSLGCVLVSTKRKSNGYDIVSEVAVTQYITKLINLKKIKNIKIINEFL